MPQDPLERVQLLLSETRVHPLALLLDLSALLPESLIQRALKLAEHASDKVIGALLAYELLKRLPDGMKRANQIPLPAGISKDDVSIPEADELKRLIPELSDRLRYDVFDRLLLTAETLEPEVDSKDSDRRTDDAYRSRKRSRRRAETKSVDDGGFGFTGGSSAGSATVESPFESFSGGTSAGGSSAGGSSAAGGFDDWDDGFESVPSAALPPPQTYPTAAKPFESTEGGTEPPDLVNLGFSQKQPADTRLKQREPLQTGHSYYFWIRIGKDVDEAAIGTPSKIDLNKLPEEAVLTVAVFEFEKELEIVPGADVGELKIHKDGKVKVLRQPVDRESISLSTGAPADYLDDYLLFPIKVPEKEATYRLRCNIYCAQVLVQSYVVSANVRRTSDPVAEACSQRLDYFLSQSLRADHLASMTKEPHLLSLMMNDNGDGSSTFRFYGSDGAQPFKDDAHIDGQQLSGFLQQARAELHRVSWGNEEEWDEKKNLAYRYQSQTFDEKKLAKDLAYLARAGSRIFTGFQIHLKKKRSELQALLANSGLIQIALKLSPRAVLPAAVVYDYDWNPNQFNFPTTDFELCPTFSKSLKEAREPDGPPLEDAPCFNGGCELKQMIAEIRKPGSGKTMSSLGPIICPSGFWGYRHLLGLPLTLDGANTEIPPVIEFKDGLEMFACVSTDPGFVERDPHLAKLKALQGLNVERDEGYDPFILRLKSDVPHLIYFYCHGGVKAGSFNPFLQIGARDELDPNNWGAEGIEWTSPNPLVFINGCHTTSLNPEVTLDFVSSFVQTSGAAGVIGTEITIFEPLAVKFAEACFKRFIGAAPFKECMPIGKAVRGARLELLRQGNPLGLVYIPYAVASLRLQEAGQN